jgi:hypothetical protein
MFVNSYYFFFALASIEFGYFVTDIFSTELGIRLSFFKISEFREGGIETPTHPPSVHNRGKVK